MKKLFIAISTLAAFTACSKMDVQYEQPAEIAISAVSMNRTKAMVTGTTFPQENFAVWAYYKQLDKGATIAQWQASTLAQQTYIDEKPFAPRTGEYAGLWGGAGTSYFWPKAGSLMFVGYYPTTMSDVVDYTFDNDDNIMTVSGYTPGDYQATGFVNTADGANHVEDFMYFNMTSTSCDASTTGPANNVEGGLHVDVVFKHALSWLTVILKKDSSTPEGATITVKKVYFTEVNTTGTGTVNNSPVGEEKNDISWETTSAETDVYVLGSSTEDNTTKLTTDYTCNQPVIIPQTMDGNIVVTYEIKSSDDSAFTETVTLPLSSITTGVTAWDPAKHYTYTVTIGTSEILIDPYIADWEVVPGTINAN